MWVCLKNNLKILDKYVKDPKFEVKLKIFTFEGDIKVELTFSAYCPPYAHVSRI